jgi:hypothetical protein
MAKKYLLFLSIVFLLPRCATSPELVMFLISPGVNQYHLPSHEWRAESRKTARAALDFTYRTNSENPVFINFSLYNTETSPRRLASAYLEGDGLVYPLENIKILYIDSKKHELRVSTEGRREGFLTLLRSKDIILRATVDGIEQIYTPGKNFYPLRDQFFADLIE